MRNGEPIDLDQFDALEVDALTRQAIADQFEKGERHRRALQHSLGGRQGSTNTMKMGPVTRRPIRVI